MSDWRKRNARALLRDFQPNGLAKDIRLANYAGEDLRGEVFAPEEDLTGADFHGADLSYARFVDVCLATADLAQARLVGARLDRADLSGASLSGACLDKASLIGADLTEADVTGASWRRAKLTKARIGPGVVLDDWGTASPHELPRLQLGRARHQVAALAWHPEGELLVGTGQQEVEIWDPGAGTTVATLTGHTGHVNAVAYSPDGTRLATAGSDRTVRIWDPGAGTPVATLTGHTDWVNPVAYSPDGTRLATAGDDGTVRIWDPGTGTTVATLTGHTSWVSAVAYSPDGTRLATASDDGTVRMTTITSAMNRPRKRWPLPWQRRLRHPMGRALGTQLCGTATALAFSPDGSAITTGHETGCAALTAIGHETTASLAYLICLPDGGWATIYGEHRYRLHGDPAGRFWWTAGLCRFEPGELDGYGVERL